MAQHQNRKHAILSASRADRWINCPPSARLEEKFDVSAPSKYAEEGTLAHEISECMLRARFRLTPVDVCSKELTKLKKNKLYSEDMDEPIGVYLNYVTDQYTEALRKTKDAVVLIEERLDFSEYVEDGFGTGDTLIIADGTMEVIDLKFGTGVPVFAENNAQLMLYGIGALRKYEMVYEIDKVKLTIVQPRQERISTWEIAVEDLLLWGDEIVRPAAALAYEGKGETKCGHWCKWCRVKPMCSTMAQENLKLAQHEFAEPQLLEMNEVVEIYSQLPMLMDWAKSIESYLLDQAVKGESVPGYKLVEGRSNRKWTNEDEVKEILEASGYQEDQYLKTSLQGIPTIEKLLKSDFKDLVGDLIEKPQGNPTLVPESDKRPAMGIEQAKLDFKN